MLEDERVDPRFVGATCNDGPVADLLAKRKVGTEDGSAERLVGAGLVDRNSFGGCQDSARVRDPGRPVQIHSRGASLFSESVVSNILVLRDHR
jgi:hypothetical protein